MPLLPLVAPIAIVSLVSPQEAQKPGAPALLEELVRVLNAGDAAARLAFAEKHCTTDVPAAQRSERLASLAERGAPFRVERLEAPSPVEARAWVVDKNGERSTLVLEASDGPDPRMIRLLVDDPESHPPRDYTGWTTLESLAESIAKDSGSPAMGIAVVRDGKLDVAVTGVREAGKDARVSADEPWSVGSIGKPICTTVIGLLVEKGKLRFETTLGEALPDVTMKPGYRDVTLEQLMKHRGGIPRDESFRAPDVRRIAGDVTTPLEIRKRYVADILSREPIAKPDSRFAYSNAGYALLSHVAERAAGMPYEELVRKTVFEPLGMTHSFVGTESLPPDRPSGHVPGPNGLRPMNMGGALESMVAGAGGGVWCSVGDLAKLGAAHLAGLRGEDGLLKAETVERLHSGTPEGGPENALYACGWGIHRHPTAGTSHGHNGSNGTMRAELAVFPKTNLVVVAIVNRGGEGDPPPGLEAVIAVASRFSGKKSGG